MSYESTKVPVEKSQAEIRKLLTTHGAAGFAFGEERDDDGRRHASVLFRHEGHAVRMRVPLKEQDDRELRRKARRAYSRTYEEIVDEAYEQEAKRVWRVLAWNLKARMVAVEEHLETFEEAFLAHLVGPTGETVYEQLARDGRVELGGPLRPELTAGDEVVDAEVIS